MVVVVLDYSVEGIMVVFLTIQTSTLMLLMQLLQVVC